MKHRIEIETGRSRMKRRRSIVFFTDESSVLPYFRQRTSISEWNFPLYVEGHVEDYADSSAGYQDWKDVPKSGLLGELQIQNIFSISIDGVDINQQLIDTAKKSGASVLFPSMIHVQLIFEKTPGFVFNWFPTTGTLTKQKVTTGTNYSVKKLGVYEKLEEAIKACS